MLPSWDCPEDLEREERLELLETNLPPGHPPIYATVEGVAFGDIYVQLDSHPGIFVPIARSVTKWRRVLGTPRHDTVPAPAPKGAWCADKHCPIRFYEYAEPSEGWKCRSCRKR